MATAYAIDVQVHLLNALGTGGAGSPSDGASAMRELDRGINDVQRSSERMMGTWGKLFALREMEKFGQTGVDAFKGVVKNAGDLEEAMLNVRLGLGLTVDETEKLKNKFYELDQAHKTSANEMARTALILQESGIRDQAAMLGLMEPGGGREGLLTFQDVMKSRPEPVGPEEAARLAMQFIDTAGIVGPAAQAQMLDLVARALKFDPQASPGGLLGAFQNIHRTGDFAGLSLEQQMQMAAMTTMGGQSGREATQIGHLVGVMQMVGHSPGKAAARKAGAMREMGILGAGGDPTGDIFSVIERISALRQEDPNAAKRLIATAFPDVRRQEEILELSEPGKLAQLQRVREEWGKLATLGQQHNVIMSGTNSAMTVFQSNIQDISSASGTGLLQAVKGIIGSLNDVAGQIKTWQGTPEGKAVSAIGAGAIGGGGAILDVGSKIGMTALLLKMLGVGTGAATVGGLGLLTAGLGGAAYAADRAGLDTAAVAGAGPFGPLVAVMKELIGVFRSYVEASGITPGTNANRPWLTQPLDAVPSPAQSYVFSQHVHHALHHMVKAASKNYSSGVRAAPGLFLNPTTGAGPR